MVKSLKKKLEDILIDGKLLKPEQLKEAIRVQKEKGGKLSQILIDLKYLSEKDIMTCIGAQLDIPPINLSKFEISPEAINIIPEQVARHYLLIPVSIIGKTLTVAMADPLNVFAMDDIRKVTGYSLKPVIGTEKDIAKAIERYYGSKETIESTLRDIELPKPEPKKEEEEMDLDKLKKVGEEAPVVRIVNVLLTQAVKEGASDIHIEPYEKNIRIRYRIDGVLYEKPVIPKSMHSALTSRIKILSRMDIAERRLPQDGRFKIKLEGREIDFRVSVIPTAHGEKVVMRILDKSNLVLGLEKLGFEENTLRIFQECILKPYGILLLTGPTGSGKTTTLYSALNQINTADKNIITIEDPIEYQLEGINQIQTQSEIGLTFAQGLRSILRQDPDIIMVGEIRDHETADIAIKSALTGHLVFSTLHTNDAPGAITRLVDMQIEPFLVSSAVIMTAAQRLARTICPKCKESYKVPAEVLKNAGFNIKEGEKQITLYKGKGCRFCNHSGYKGRIAIFEIFMPRDELKEMILKRQGTNVIRQKAIQYGMKTLRDSGLLKVRKGITTLEEILRVTSEV